MPAWTLILAFAAQRAMVSTIASVKQVPFDTTCWRSRGYELPTVANKIADPRMEHGLAVHAVVEKLARPEGPSSSSTNPEYPPAFFEATHIAGGAGAHDAVEVALVGHVELDHPRPAERPSAQNQAKG